MSNFATPPHNGSRKPSSAPRSRKPGERSGGYSGGRGTEGSGTRSSFVPRQREQEGQGREGGSRAEYKRRSSRQGAEHTPGDFPGRAFHEPRTTAPEPAEFQSDTPQEGQGEPSLLPGIKPVLELLETNPERVDTVFLRKGRHGTAMDKILDICRTAKVRFSLLDQTAFSRLYRGQSQGVLARLYEAGFVEVEDLFAQVMEAPLPLIVLLDQVKDPGNAGTLARTLYALGGAGLIIPRHNAAYLGAHAAKASAGALEYLPVARAGSITQTLDAAIKQGFTLYGAAMGAAGKDSPPVHDVFTFAPRLPALLLLGSEEDGLRPILVKRCHALVHIPMQRDFDSLNVAQAGAICIGAFLQRLLEKKKG